MILAHHVIFCAYGFWLPNDPRGSWSAFVGAWELLRFGKATKTDTRRSVAAKAHDLTSRQAAKGALKYPRVHFTGLQANAIARGFASHIAKTNLTVWACSIMPDHVHMVIARHGYDIEQSLNLLKGAATRQLADDGLHPLASFTRKDGRTPTPWARGEWKVFLNTPADIRRSIEYVRRNPIREGKREQAWKFVLSYDG